MYSLDAEASADNLSGSRFSCAASDPSPPVLEIRIQYHMRLGLFRFRLHNPSGVNHFPQSTPRLAVSSSNKL